DGLRPELIVLHYTVITPATAALARLCDPEHEVSAHYVIGEEGEVWQLVREEDRAWHAGEGEWCGKSDINSRSVGIELVNDGASEFAEPLMASLEALLPGIMARWGIKPEGVIGHSDMAPGRKVDPGAFFDWERLAGQRLAAYGGYDEGPGDPNFESFRKVAQYAGYTAEASDEALLNAVRLRWRRGAEGPLCSEDFSPLGHAALWT
ncbi:MAG: N-acetylmuramoyl-L-alanine amidase, partial [Pseudomonadota bacterium]